MEKAEPSRNKKISSGTFTSRLVDLHSIIEAWLLTLLLVSCGQRKSEYPMLLFHGFNKNVHDSSATITFLWLILGEKHYLPFSKTVTVDSVALFDKGEKELCLQSYQESMANFAFLTPDHWWLGHRKISNHMKNISEHVQKNVMLFHIDFHAQIYFFHTFT